MDEENLRNIYGAFGCKNPFALREVSNLTREEVLKLGEVYDFGEDKTYWKSVEVVEGRRIDLISPEKVGKKISLNYDGSVDFPRGASYHQRMLVESYLISRGIKRPWIVDGKLEDILSS